MAALTSDLNEGARHSCGALPYCRSAGNEDDLSLDEVTEVEIGEGIIYILNVLGDLLDELEAKLISFVMRNGFGE